MAEYSIPEHIASKCKEQYGFSIAEAIEERLSTNISMNALSKKYGIARSNLSNMFREIGIDTTHTHLGQQHLVDQEWLYEEYVNKKRTQADIAKELGLGKNVISRLINKLGWEQEPQTLCEKYNIDSKWLREQVEEHFRTFSSIAEEIDVSSQILRRAVQEEKIVPPPNVTKKRKSKTQQFQYELYDLRKDIEEGTISITQLSSHFGISETSIRRILKENNISYPPNKYSNTSGFCERFNISEEWIREQRLVHRRPVADIASDIGCPVPSLDKFCRSIGCGGQVAPRTAIEKLGISNEWLVEQYIDKNRSFTDIAQELNLNQETVSKYYKKNNLPMRDDSDANFCEFYGVTQEWFIEQVNSGRTTSSLAKEMNTTKKRIKRLKDTYVSCKKNKVPLYVKHNIDVEWLREQRLVKGVSLRKLEKEMNLSRTTIKQICKECDIVLPEERAEAAKREKNRRNKRKKLYAENKWKHEQYLEAIAQASSPDNEEEERPSALTRVEPLYEKYNIEPSVLRKMLDSDMQIKEIAKQLKISNQTIKQVCKELGYTKRRIPPHELHNISYKQMYDERIINHTSFEDIGKKLHILPKAAKDAYLSLELDKVEIRKVLDEVNLTEQAFLDLHEIPDGIRSDNTPCTTYVKFIQTLIENLHREEKITPEQLNLLYKEQSLAVRKIAQIMQLSEEYIYRLIAKYQLRRKNIAESLGIDYKWLYKKIVIDKLTFTDIARELNATTADIRSACVLLHVDIPVLTTGERHNVSYQEAKSVVETPNLSHKDIAERMGVSITTAYKIIRDYGLTPPRNALSESENEIKWERFLDETGVEYITHQFCLPTKENTMQEIDIVIPEYNIGIEISPAYTHNSDEGPYYGSKQGKPKPRNYHQSKAVSAENIGMNLVHIFDWYQDDKIENILLSLLHMNDKIYARNTTVQEINKKDEREFFTESHLQGYVKSTCCYALIVDNDIVAAMSFGRPRFGNKEDAEWELLRFASKPGITVVGGASKLFQHFLNQHNPKSIMSYCNYDISNGNLYETLGFSYVRTVRPSYYWVKNGRDKVCYSWNLIKSRGVDNILGTHYGKGKSNIQLMLNEGFVRVYNCGNKVYKWERDEQ